MDNKPKQDSEEIDIIEVIVRLLHKRRFIVKVTGVFVALGLLIALFSPVRFTSQTVIVPQVSSPFSSTSSSLGSLAQLAGFSLGSLQSEELISPMIYSKVLRNVNFQKDLIYTPIYFGEYNRDITLFDYFTADEYKKFSLMKYTIGLPGLIMKAIRGKQPTSPYLESGSSTLNFYSEQEMECVEQLEDLIGLTFDETDGYVTIQATMPEAIASSQLAIRVQTLLQQYITDFKIEKALVSYQFVKSRYDDAKSDLEIKQREYANFKDANKLLSSATSQIKETALLSEYNLANSTFEELAMQLIQAEIKIKEDTPTFTVIEPATVPNRKSAPKRVVILVLFGFMGVFVGCGLVLLLDVLKTNSSVNLKALDNWE